MSVIMVDPICPTSQPEADACEGCGRVDDTVEAVRDYCGRLRADEGRLLCEDCAPRCGCQTCDPDYYNDIRFDR